jgi:integrase/recombinase XerC
MSTEIIPRFRFPRALATTDEDVIESWLKGRNEKTRRGYLSDLAHFARWAKAPAAHMAVSAFLHMKPGEANRVALLYRAAMVDDGLSSATINRRLAALRSMVKVARMIGKVTWTLDVENIKSEKRRDMRGPDLADVRLMFRAAADMGDGKRARRDRAILAMSYDLDLRRNEVCMLDLADVETNANGLPIAVRIIGKGHREKQRLTVPPATAQALSGWLEARGAEPGPLFQRCDGHEVDPDLRLSGESIRLVVARIAKAAGLKYTVRPHGLRHAATTDALEAGKSVQDVKKFGRWATLEMVIRYDDSRHDTAGEIANLVSKRRHDRGDKSRA